MENPESQQKAENFLLVASISVLAVCVTTLTVLMTTAKNSIFSNVKAKWRTKKNSSPKPKEAENTAGA